MDGITVVIPSIPTRREMLARAFTSVLAQTHPATAIVIEVDNDRTGAAETRHRGLQKVTTEWVAFLDDDDELEPHHLQVLMQAALAHSADYVWSQFRIGYPGPRWAPGPAPLGPGTFRQWQDDDPVQTTITTLVRTDLAVKVGGFAGFQENGKLIDGQRHGEDFAFTLRCRAAGAVFRHAPEVTWTWHHWGGNTSGRPDRW